MDVHAGQRGVGPQLADQARRVERRPAGELGTLQQQHVGLTALREVVGHACAAHTPADDHDAGAVRQLAHGRKPYGTG